jgi:hypothetical protein
MQSAITSLATESNAVLGSTAQAAYQTSCASGDQSNAQLCSTLSTAIGDSTDPDAIGAALRAQLQK